MSNHENAPGKGGEPQLRVETGARIPDSLRAELVAEVRRRLEAGELDSDLARIETALALLDGDPDESG